jgi:hypothetical protein
MIMRVGTGDKKKRLKKHEKRTSTCKANIELKIISCPMRTVASK